MVCLSLGPCWEPEPTSSGRGLAPGRRGPWSGETERERGEGAFCMHDVCGIYPQTDWSPQAKRPVDKRGCHWTMCMWVFGTDIQNWRLKRIQTITPHSLTLLRKKNMSLLVCLRMFVFITPHLHINGKSACWFLGGDCMCFAGGWGASRVAMVMSKHYRGE